MACCDSSSSLAYWSLFGHRGDGKRKLSVRPMFSRGKRSDKKLEPEKDVFLDSRGSYADSGRSPSQVANHSASRGSAYTTGGTVAKKFSQPLLRALKSVRDLQLLHSLSDVDLRKNSSLAANFDHGNNRDSVASVTCISSGPIREQARPLRPILALDQQQKCHFLMLPQEIRDEIYAYVFYSTRLTMGRRVTCATPTPITCAKTSLANSSKPPKSDCSQKSEDRTLRIVTHTKPARHSLALFYVCRQVTRELRADDAWLGQVLFNFEDAATMLDILGGALTPIQRGLVREVRVREGGLFVNQRMSPQPTPAPSSASLTSPAQQHHLQQFRQRFLLLGGLMRLLPGLQLDRLTVLPALPCRLHKSTRCHNYPSIDMYSMTVNSNPPPPINIAAPHEMLAELLHTGSGWRELCYVHHDTNILAADRQRPSSLEAMMVNMGFWDTDSETYDEVFMAAERAEREDSGLLAGEEQAVAMQQQGEGEPQNGAPFIRQHRRHRLGSLFASYSARKEYRLPRWRHMLTERDGLVPTTTKTQCANAAGWNVSIDAVIDEGFYEGDTPRSTISVYGVRGGQAMWPMETLEDVHDSRIRGEDFMVIARRYDNRDDGDYKDRTARNRNTDGNKEVYAEVVGNPYPFKEGDPRVLGYGTRWETLRPVLFPWDHLTATRCKRDRYQHRDEYVVRSQRRRCF